MTFMTEDVKIPLFSVLVGYGYFPHGRSGWREGHCVRYHAYPIPENHSLPDTVGFAYQDGILVESRKNALSLKRVGGSREADIDVQN